MTDHQEQWSETLNKATRDALDRLTFVPDGDIVCLKHADGRFGMIAVDDVLRQNLKLIDRKTKQETTFANADELIRAGWALD